MGKEIAFFLAGWISVAIGFEVAPMYGNVAGVLSFIVLHVLFSRRTKRAADGAWDCPKCKKPNIAVASKCWFCEAPRR